jgi:hypothetical protein
MGGIVGVGDPVGIGTRVAVLVLVDVGIGEGLLSVSMIWVERTGSVGRLAVSLGLTAGEQPHKANARRQATGRRIALTSLVEI